MMYIVSALNRSVTIMSERKKKGPKKALTAVLALLLVSGAAAGGLYAYRAGIVSADEAAVNYREYSISRGNVTVGTTESGTVSVEREYVTSPCQAEVLEVYVNTGTRVEEGDLLMKLDADDISKLKAEKYKKVNDAKSALDKALTEQSEKTFDARQTLESSVAGGSTAQAEYEMYLEKNAASDKSSAEELAELEEQLVEYKALVADYPADYKKLSAAEDELDAMKDTYEGMEDKYKALQKEDKENSAALERLYTASLWVTSLGRQALAFSVGSSKSGIMAANFSFVLTSCLTQCTFLPSKTAVTMPPSRAGAVLSG